MGPDVVCPKCGTKMYLDLSSTKVREYKCPNCGNSIEYWYVLVGSPELEKEEDGDKQG